MFGGWLLRERVCEYISSPDPQNAASVAKDPSPASSSFLFQVKATLDCSRNFSQYCCRLLTRAPLFDCVQLRPNPLDSASNLLEARHSATAHSSPPVLLLDLTLRASDLDGIMYGGQ